MNKADLINALAAKNEISKKDAEKAVNAVLGLIEEALKNGEKVQIMGFGSFEVKSAPPEPVKIRLQERRFRFLQARLLYLKLAKL